MTSVASSQSNPFVGPRAFRTGEVLYGRDRETRKLVNLLIAERIVLLHAPSGAGKTSLVQAAVVPQMRERGFEVFPAIRLNAAAPPAPQDTTVMLPATNRYVWSTLLALEEQRAERIAPDELATLSLNAYLDRRITDADSDIMLVFDQFEEVLTLDPINREAKLAFFRQLGEALEDRRRWALFAIRGDRLSELEPYARPIPTQFATRFPLELLGPRAAREAIQRPAEEQGIHFTASAAERLIADLSRVRVQRPDGTSEDLPGDVVEPVQLQVVCYRLWERIAPGASEIGESDIATVGDVDTALGNYYSERVAAIAEATGTAERTIRAWCEEQLITEQDVRGQVLRGKDESSGLGNAAIQGLVDTHLVRADSRRGAVWYELAHDRLIAPIRKNNAAWREEHLSTLQRQALIWKSQGKAPEFLLQGNALVDAEQWAEANPKQMAPLDTELLNESIQARDATRQQQQSQRNRIIAIVASGLGLIILVALVVSLSFFFQAREQAGIAQRAAQEAEAARVVAQRAAQEAETARVRAVRAERGARLTAQAGSSFETQPQLGLLLAVEAANATSAETQTVITNASSASAVSTTSTITDTAQREVFRQGLKIIGGEPLGSLGHAVSAIAYSPDGRLIAAAGGPTVLVWDRFSAATAPRTIAYAGGGTTALAFSPDGHWFTAAYTDGLVRLWPISADDQLGTEQALHGHTDRVNALAFHPQSIWLATASSDHTVRLWDLRSQDSSPSSQQVLQHDNAIWSIIFSADGRQLLYGSASVRIWDFGDDGPVGTPRTLDTGGTAYQLALSPDGRWLAAGLDNYGLKFWDLTQPDPQDLKINGSEWVTVPRFSPDGRWLVLPGPSTFVRDLTNGDVATQKPDVLPAVAFIGSASAFSPDGRWLVTAGNDRIVRVWDMRNLSEPARLMRGHEASILAVAFSPDGTHLASADETGAVREWEAPFFAADPEVLSGPAQSQGVHTWQIAPGERPRPQHLLSSEGTYYGISVSRDGRWAAVLAGDGSDLRLWDLQHPAAGPQTLEGGSYYWAMPIFDPQGRWLIGGDTDGRVRLWSLAEGKVGTILAEWQAHENNAVRQIDVSADGQRLATCGNTDGLARVWFLGGNLLPPQSVNFNAGGGRTGTIRTVAISADGTRLITGSWENDYAARIWNLADPSQAPVELQFKNRVFDVAFSPDGRWAAAGSWDDTVGLFDLKTPAQKPTLLTGFRARVLTLDFSPDGRWLAVGNEDRTVRLWDLRLNDLSIPQVVIEGPYKIGFVQFSPDGRWLLTEEGEYRSEHFDASGRVLVTGYEQTRLYHMDEAELRVLACRAAGRNLTPTEWQRYMSGFQGASPRPTCPAPDPSLAAQAAGQREAVETALRRAFTLLNSSRIDEALTVLEQVQRLDPERVTVPLALHVALTLAENGDGPAALRAFNAIQARDARQLSADNWNTLCWRGSLFGHAKEVLPACERAVALDPGNGGIRDSRGLARALAGDVAGAIADFEAFIRWAPDNQAADLVPIRTAWIETLRAGGNPFDGATILQLRQK